MLSSCVYVKFLVHGVAELVLWKHAFHADFDEALRASAAHFCNRKLFQTAWVTRVVLVFLDVLFIACETDLVGIDNDDEVSCVHVRRVFRMVFSTKDGSDAGAKTAEDFSFSVNDKPAAIDLFFLDRPGFIA